MMAVVPSCSSGFIELVVDPYCEEIILLAGPDEQLRPGLGFSCSPFSQCKGRTVVGRGFRQAGKKSDSGEKSTRRQFCPPPLPLSTTHCLLPPDV